MADEVVKDLQSWYRPLEGMTFQGTYQGEFTMPQTGNQRDLLVIGQGNFTFGATLNGISSAVLTKYGKTVWKGFTGPEDDPARYTNHRMWVELPDANEEKLKVGFCYNFQIARCTPFTCSGGDFWYGVSIKVHKLSQ